MLFRFFPISIIFVLLFSCSSKVKDEASSSIEVEELSMNDIGDDSAAYNSEEVAVAYGSDNVVAPIFNNLDDPDSLLSIRIIYFNYDSSQILSEYRLAIEAHASYLLNNKDETLTLEGHADERGSREYNLALGEGRAQAVKQQMLLLGVPSEQIRIVSYGEEHPIVDESHEGAWQQNRRVEILY